MEICVRSAYDYLVCESRFDTKELLQAIKKDLDINFGSTYGFSSKKGEWEKVIVTEAEIIRILKIERKKKAKRSIVILEMEIGKIGLSQILYLKL